MKKTIVDTNCFSNVFIDTKNKYKQLANEVKNKKHIIIMGGTRYNNEINRTESHKKFRLELSNKRILNDKFNDKDIDLRELEIIEETWITFKKNSKNKKKYNDPHIIALIDFSKANLLCTEDNGLKEFSKKSKFYKKGGKPPTIFGDRYSI